MKILVTGADGFVGGWLVRALFAAGHSVAGTGRNEGAASLVLTPEEAARVDWRLFDLRDTDSVRSAVRGEWDAVVHLAAVSSGAEARKDPGLAWDVNAAGTARLAEALLPANPLLLLVSTGEVYGQGQDLPRREEDPVQPCSPYAASKAGAELAALEVWRRLGLPVVIARPFTHTGAGQETRFVLPAFVERMREAKATGARTVPSGNLDPIRDLLDVRDVVEAYLLLLRSGQPGEVYNVARGEGSSVRELFEQLSALVGVRVEPEVEPSLARAADIPHLVGDSTKLRHATGWAPSRSLEQTLRGLVDAEAD